MKAELNPPELMIYQDCGLNKKRTERLLRSFLWLAVQKCNLTNHAKGVYVIRPKGRYTLRVMPYACGNCILAHARLHTNPLDWIEKRCVNIGKNSEKYTRTLLDKLEFGERIKLRSLTIFGIWFNSQRIFNLFQ